MISTNYVCPIHKQVGCCTGSNEPLVLLTPEEADEAKKARRHGLALVDQDDSGFDG
jgi:hypothetical protein